MMRNAKGPDIPYLPNQALFRTDLRVPFTTEEIVDPMPVAQFMEARTHFVPPAPIKGRWHVPPIKQKFTNLEEVRHVLVKRNQKRPLQYPYVGPFKVLSLTDKSVTVEYHNKQLTVSRDCVKPLYQYQSQTFFPAKDDIKL